MIKAVIIVLFLSCTSFVISQNNANKLTEASASTANKKNNAPTLIALGKSESDKSNIAIKKDTLPTPEMKPFAIFHANSKANDSTVLPKAELIPYTGYKKDKDN